MVGARTGCCVWLCMSGCRWGCMAALWAAAASCCCSWDTCCCCCCCCVAVTCWGCAVAAAGGIWSAAWMSGEAATAACTWWPLGAWAWAPVVPTIDTADGCSTSLFWAARALASSDITVRFVGDMAGRAPGRRGRLRPPAAVGNRGRRRLDELFNQL